MSNRRLSFLTGNEDRQRTPSKPSFGGILPISEPHIHRDSLRRSLLVSQRRSTYFAVNKKPRDVKNLFNANLAAVHSFLVEHDGEDAPRLDVLQRPSKRDFINVFETVYQVLNPKFAFGNEPFEQLTIRLLGELGYPTVIKASNFNPIGAPHSWMLLLDAIAWLVEFVKLTKQTDKSVLKVLHGLSDERHTMDSVFKFSWYSSTYKKYTNNRDPEMVKEKGKELHKFYEEMERLEPLCCEKRETLDALNAECEKLELEANAEEEKKKDILQTMVDIKRAEEHKVECERDCNDAVEKLKESEEEMKLADDEKLAWSQRVEQQMEQLVVNAAKVGLSVDDVRQLVSDFEEDKIALNLLVDEASNNKKMIWNLQREYDAEYKQLSSHLELAQQTLDDLRRKGAVAEEFAQIVAAPKSSEDLMHNVNSVQANVQVLETAFHKQQLSTRSTIARCLQEDANAVVQKELENDRLAEMKKVCQTNERVRRREREAWKSERHEISLEIDRLQAQKDALEENLKDGDIGKELAAEKREFDAVKAACDEKAAELVAAIRIRLDPIMQHMKDMENSEMWMTKTLKELLDGPIANDTLVSTLIEEQDV